MNAASPYTVHEMRPAILDRRARLEAAAGSLSPQYLNSLLAEIDAALQKIDSGAYGLCEVCHDPIEPEQLQKNPLARFCIDHLSVEERKAHEQDIQLATQIQAKLLPARDIRLDCWETHYRYEPAGAVGGDYCELIASDDGKSLFFAVGDVAGKGVAASLLMTHLSAIFRSLVSLDLPLGEIISRANRLFCDSTSSAHYATLVCGRTTPWGVDVCNAGHCRPLVLRRNAIDRVEPTGLPLGLFSGGCYEVANVRLEEEESLVLYSDGITEARDPEGNEFDEAGLIRSLGAHSQPGTMADNVLREIAGFRKGGRPSDDLTLLIVRRNG
jgi:sigma-B regulation protein RsbU (phosphoserine phosphatase)